MGSLGRAEAGDVRGLCRLTSVGRIGREGAVQKQRDG